jgi:hypothetical protein
MDWHNPNASNRPDFVRWIFVALAFGWDDIFRKASREAVMGYVGTRELRYGGDYLPAELRGKIKSHMTLICTKGMPSELEAPRS